MAEMDEEFLLQEEARPYGLRHRSFYFSKAIIFFIKDCKYERIYTSIFDQLLRSATSIGANVVEGKSGSSLKDWVNFLNIALKSANETKYWLCLIRDTMSVNKEKVQELLKEADELSKIIAAIIIKAKTN
ncbi:MAG: four helix bundle protein [Chitinophagaceae bacterium]